MMQVALQVDQENDQLYILFKRDRDSLKGIVAKTVKLMDNVYADMDAKGKLVGLDIQGASGLLGLTNLEEISSKQVMTLKIA